MREATLTERFIRGRLFVFLVVGVPCVAEPTWTETALDRYVAKPDASFEWRHVSNHADADVRTHLLELVSQRWRSADEVDRNPWRHWLSVVVPGVVEHDTALLFISGGDNEDGPPEGPDPRMIGLATATHSVVASLRMVPNQPLVFSDDPHNRRKEDAIIAYTWDKYLDGGDETWPLLLPMTKSAARAMDAVQAFLKTEAGGAHRIESFVVSGASKRGWTTWLTAAVDRRVAAIIPIVIDMLNTRASMKHHHAAYGFWAPAIDDYVEAGIPDRMDQPETESLLRVVDPYSYRERLTMPKFIINAAGDQFFLPDSWRFYYDELKGENHLRYVPNTGHSLKATDAFGSLQAYYQAILDGTPLPRFTWSAAPGGPIRVQTESAPLEVNLWRAHNPAARDFRWSEEGPRWSKSRLEAEGEGVYVARVAEPETGWSAYFVELVYGNGGSIPFKFTTGVNVIPDVLPFADQSAEDADRP